MSKLRIAYIPSESSGVNFYRMWQPAEALRRMGHEVALLWYSHKQLTRHPWQQDILSDEWCETLYQDIDMACEWADAVIWGSLHTPYTLEIFRTMKQRHGSTAFLTEFDDIVFKIPEGSAAADFYYPGSELNQLAMAQIGMSDALIVSTPGLKDMMPHPRVYVAENAIDLSLWRGHFPNRQRLTIGWMGGASHSADLEMVKEPLIEVLAKFPQVRVKVLHGAPEFLKHKMWCKNLTNPPKDHNKRRRCLCCKGLDGVSWTHNFYTIDRYPRWVSRQSFDIGLAPLVDNAFNRAKSNLRWLEYSAMGVPTIASPVSHFVKTIREGETGYFARDAQEWVDRISQLVNEPETRENVGMKARQEVLTRWNPNIQAAKVVTALEDVLNARPYKSRPGDEDR